VNIQSALNNNNTTNNENDNNNNMMKSTLLLMLATKALCQHTDILTQFVIDFFPDTPDLLESYRYYGRMIKEDKSELTCNCQCSSVNSTGRNCIKEPTYKEIEWCYVDSNYQEDCKDLKRSKSNRVWSYQACMSPEREENECRYQEDLRKYIKLREKEQQELIPTALCIRAMKKSGKGSCYAYSYGAVRPKRASYISGSTIKVGCSGTFCG